MPTRPDHLINPKDKNREWLLNCAEWIWQDYGSLTTNIGACNSHNYQLWRNHRMGIQDVTQYKTQLGCDDTSEEILKVIDWTTLPYLQKLHEVIKGKMDSLGYKMSATAINPLAIDEKEKVRYDYQFRQLIAPYFPSLAPSEGEPQTPEQLEVFMKDYKLAAEVACETVWEMVAHINNFDSVKTLLIEDLIDYGVCFVRDTVEANGNIKTRRVDIESLVVGFTKCHKFSDCAYFGEIRYLTLSEIKSIDNGANFGKKELEEIKAQGRSSFYSQTTTPWFASHSSIYNERDGKVACLEFSIESIDDIEVAFETDSNGNLNVKTKDLSSTDRKTNTYKKKSLKTYYTGIWVIGTKHIFAYGRETNVKRYKESLTEAVPNWHGYAPTMRNMQCYSLMSRCIGIDNNLQLAWYNWQYMIAKAKPKGMAFDVWSLMNVPKSGGGTYKPLELIELLQQTGDALYSSLDGNGNPMNSKPPFPIENGISQDLDRLTNAMRFCITQMNEVIGLNDFTDAGNPKADTGKAVALQAVSSSNNALQSLYVAYGSVLERTANSCIMRYQDLNPNGKEEYAMAIGTGIAKYFNIYQDVSLYDMGIRFQPAADQEEIQILQQQIANELAIRSQGGDGGLLVEDVFAIRDIMKTSPKQAAVELERRRKIRQQEAQAIAQQNQQANAQMQNAPLEMKMQIEEMKAQMKLQSEQMKLDAQAQLIQMRESMITERERMLAILESQKSTKDIQLKSEAKSSEIAMQGETDAHLLEMQHQNNKELESNNKPKE